MASSPSPEGQPAAAARSSTGSPSTWCHRSGVPQPPPLPWPCCRRGSLSGHHSALGLCTLGLRVTVCFYYARRLANTQSFFSYLGSWNPSSNWHIAHTTGTHVNGEMARSRQCGHRRRCGGKSLGAAGSVGDASKRVVN